MIEERLLKLEEVAGILGVCRRTVERLIARQQLPVPVRIGRISRIPASDVAAYIEQLKQERGDDPLRV